MSALPSHPEDALRFLGLLARPGDVFEMRGLSKRGGRPTVWSGFFDDMTLLARAAVERSGRDDGIYVTINPVHRGLLSRLAKNRVHQAGNGDTSSDKDIPHRRHLLIDVDPVRPAGISSTDEEHAAAAELVTRIAAELGGLGWPAPLVADSGNGGHLIYAIDLPRDDGHLVARVLSALSKRFSTPALKVDEKVFNPARISKIYGTLTRKGESTDERPHRVSRIVSAPAAMAIVTREQLEAFAPAAAPTLQPNRTYTPRDGRARFDLEAFIAEHLPDAQFQDWSGGENGSRKWLLPTCPFNSGHDRREAFIVEMNSGAVSAGCKHDSCVWTWRELRQLLDPRTPPPESRRADTVRTLSDAERIEIETFASRDDDDASPPPVELDADTEPFECGADGKIYHSQANIALALRKLRVSIRYDMFADRELVDGLDGFGPEIDDAAMNRLRMLIDSRCKFRLSKDFFYDFIADYARNWRYHPVRNYLNGLRWDGVARLDTWLTSYGGASDTPYTRAVGRIVLVAAVRRVRDPGCKYDEMLILESEQQGKNKSTALAVLAGNPEWFCDDLPLGEDTQRLMESTMGRWIIEAGELKGMSKGDIHELKGYLSRCTDSARMAYGRKRKPVPRQFIIIGTTNETADYLRDSSGARRFWPVRINEFDVVRLRADRDQLWAEASHREASGSSIRLDPALYAAASLEQEERRAEDSMEHLIAKVFGELTGKVPTVEAWQVLGIEGRAPTPDEMARFTTAMRRQGWVKGRRRFDDGGREYCFTKGDEEQSKQVLVVTGKGAFATATPTGGGNRVRGLSLIGRDLRE